MIDQISDIFILKIRNFHISNQTFILQGLSEAVAQRCFIKIGVLKNFAKFTGKHLCQNLFFNKAAGLRAPTLKKKKALAQVFSCEFCEIYKNIYFYRTHLVAASRLIPDSLLFFKTKIKNNLVCG